jgi:hypothetical protein
MIEQKDWSQRHARLRMAMVSVALIVFLCSRLGLGISPSQFGLTTASWLTREISIFLLALCFLYLFLRFAVRTHAEMLAVSAYYKKIQSALGLIAHNRNKTSDLSRRSSGALLAGRLAGWGEALRSATATPGPADAVLFSTLRTKLDLLDSLTQRLEHALQTRDFELAQSNTTDAAPKTQPLWELEAERLQPLANAVAELGRTLEHRTRTLNAALATSRDAIQDAQRLFSNEAGSGTEDLNARLASAVSQLETISGHLRADGRAFYLDRYIFAVRLPQFFALALVALSADVIAAGANQSALRLTDLAVAFWTGNF